MPPQGTPQSQIITPVSHHDWGWPGDEQVVIIVTYKNDNRHFPGSPVPKTPSFHCRGDGFDPWSGN